MRNARGAVWVLVAGAVASAAACGDDGTVGGAAPDSGAPVDGGSIVDSGGTLGDAAVDSPIDAAADVDASDAGAVDYHDMTNAAFWSTFDLATAPTTDGLLGAAFDGRYVHMVPANGGAAARYDTQTAFGSASSWTTFSPSAAGSTSDYQGGVFDGRYVYFTPSTFSSTATAIRFDTMAAGGYAATASWETFATTSLAANVKGFSGGVFDGRYVYYVPWYNGTASGIAARYDTQGTFGSSTAWTTFDTTTVNGSAAEFNGGVFDGRYVYFVPGNNGLVTRYDTQATFTDGAAWSTFDGTTKNANAREFYGGGFDGRYVYFAPYSNSLLLRYDTKATFADASAWSTFDVATVLAGSDRFYGTAFDGRFLYLIPSSTPRAILRYDTTASLSAATSWSSFDLTTLDAAVAEFGGAAFDGRYLTLVPVLHGTKIIVARFDAKTPASLPALPAHYGSFY